MRVLGFGLALGLAQRFGFRVWDVTQGFEFRVLGFCSGFWDFAQGFGFRVFGSGVGFWGSA